MATVTQFRLWNNVPTRQVIDTSTGEIKVYLTDAAWNKTDFIASGLGKPAPLLASAGGKDWETTIDLGRAFRTYNPSKRTSSDAEVNQGFQVAGRKVFDNDRANVLNTKTNYDTQEQFENNTRAFYTLGIPRIRDPFNGLSNNSNGVTQTEQTESSVVPGADPQGGTTRSGADDLVDVQLEQIDTGSSEGEAGGAQDTVKPQATDASAYPSDPYETVPTTPLVLRYPYANLDVARQLGISYDYIKIRVVDYIGSISKDAFDVDLNSADLKVGESLTSQTPTQLLLNRRSLFDIYKKNQGTYATVILPMQPEGLSSNNSTSWGEGSLDILQLIVGQAAAGFLRSTDKFSIDTLTTSANNLFQNLKSVASTAVANRQAIASYLAGMITNTGQQLGQRSTGTVINPNLEMLFNGPRLRSFVFTFSMAPRFEREAQEIRTIIKVFKKYMAPQQQVGNAFLKAPRIFLLDYIYNGDQSDGEVNAEWLSSPKTHPYLNKIKPCALTSFDVDYTPDNAYMTYRDGGSMTAYNIRMVFSEIEPVYSGDIRIESNDMGF